MFPACTIRLPPPSFATVKQATHKGEGSKFAIKIIQRKQMSKEDAEALQTEVSENPPHHAAFTMRPNRLSLLLHYTARARVFQVQIMKNIEHENVVQLKEVFDCSAKFYMVIDLCTGGELFDRIVKKQFYTEDEARKCMLQVVGWPLCSLWFASHDSEPGKSVSSRLTVLWHAVSTGWWMSR